MPGALVRPGQGDCPIQGGPGGVLPATPFFLQVVPLSCVEVWGIAWLRKGGPAREDKLRPGTPSDGHDAGKTAAPGLFA